MTQPAFKISIQYQDLLEIDKQARLQKITRSELIRKAIRFAIANNITSSTPSSFKPKNTTSITFSCPQSEKDIIDHFVKKHKIIKSRWIVGLLLDKEPQEDIEIKYYAEKLGKKLTDKDTEKIKQQFSLFLKMKNPKIKQTIIEQYFINAL